MPRNYNILVLIIIPFIVGVSTFYFISGSQIFSGIYTQIGYTLGFLASGLLTLLSFKKTKLNYKKEIKRFDRNIYAWISIGIVISLVLSYGPFRSEWIRIVFPFVVAFCISTSVFYFLKIIIFKKNLYQSKAHKKFAKHANTTYDQALNVVYKPVVFLASLGFLFTLVALILAQLLAVYAHIFRNKENNLMLLLFTIAVLLITLFFFIKLFRKFWITSKGLLEICVFITVFFILLAVYFSLSY